MGRTIPGYPKGSKMTKLFITDGKQERLNGPCVYFTRTKPDLELTDKNADSVISISFYSLFETIKPF